MRTGTVAGTEVPSKAEPRASRRFVVGVAAVSVGALAVRVQGTLLMFGHRGIPYGDQLYFVQQGALLAQGHRFVNPFLLAFSGKVRASAAHPPLFSVYMAGVWLARLRSPLQVRIAVCVLGVATVVVVAIATRFVAGARAGLIAAAITAVMPSLWVLEAKAASEALSALLAAATVLAGSAFWRHPTPTRAAALSGAVALMALTRAEAMLLFLLLVVPLVIAVARRDSSSVRAPLVVTVVTALVVLGPWIAYNQTRFSGPTLISNGLGATLAVSNCADTYGGKRLGFWSPRCGTRSSATDEAVRSEDGRRQAERFVRAHLGRVPIVVAARVGRVWGVYRPWQSATYEAAGARETLWPNRIAWMLFLLLVPFAALGAVVLHRRRETVIPMVAMAVMVTVTAALFWGSTRFASPLVVALCVLAGVGVDHLLPARAPAAPAPGPVPARG